MIMNSSMHACGLLAFYDYLHLNMYRRHAVQGRTLMHNYDYVKLDEVV